MSHNALHSLVQAGLTGGDINALGGAVSAQQALLRSRGFPESYIQSLQGMNLLNADPNSLALLTGQGEVGREAQGLQAFEQAAQGRATSAQGALNFRLQVAQMLRNAEQNPFRLGEHLANLSQIGGKTATPIQTLIGQGTVIEPRLPDPLQGDRYQALLDSIFGFATGQPDTQDFGHGGNLTIGEDAVVLGRRTGRPLATLDMGEELTIRPRKTVEMQRQGRGDRFVPDFAHGGTITGAEGLRAVAEAYKQSGSTLAAKDFERQLVTTRNRQRTADTRTAGTRFTKTGGEFAGREVELDPNTRNLTDVGTGTRLGFRIENDEQRARVLAQADIRTRIRNGTLSQADAARAQQEREQYYRRQLTFEAGGGEGGVNRFEREQRRVGDQRVSRGFRGETTERDGGTRDGTSITPRVAAAKALGKALEASNPFAHQDMIDALLAGRQPPPGSVTQRFLGGTSQTLLDTLFGVYQGFGTLPQDAAFDIDRFAIRGLPVGSVRR